MQESEIREIFKQELAIIALNYKEVFTIPEASKYLEITEDYMRKLCKTKKVKANKPNGKTWYIRRTDIENYAMGISDDTVKDEALRQAQQYELKQKLKK